MTEHVEARRRAQLAAQAAKRARSVSLVCDVCHQPFETTADRQAATVCGRVCKKARKAADAKRWKQQNREKHLAMKRRQQRTPTGVAGRRRRAAQRAAKLLNARVPQRKSCAECGAEFARSGKWKCCGPDCRAANKRRVARADYHKHGETQRAVCRERSRRSYESNPIKFKDRRMRRKWLRIYGNGTPTLFMLLEERLQLHRDLNMYIGSGRPRMTQ